MLLEGDDFTSVESVVFNDLKSPSFFIFDKHRMQATLPDALSAAGVRTVTVTSRRLVMTSQSILKFKLGTKPSKVNGILKLVQLFVKVLFTTQGTDIFRPNVGGNGKRNIGRNHGKDGGLIIKDFSISVQTTTRQIIASQANQPQLPADERLLNAEIISVEFNSDELALSVQINLTSHAGRSALVNMVTNNGTF